MLPDPTFISRAFKTETEAADWIDEQPESEKLIAWYDEPNQFWQVTTKANFECSEYWTGQVEEAWPGDQE